MTLNYSNSDLINNILSDTTVVFRRGDARVPATDVLGLGWADSEGVFDSLLCSFIKQNSVRIDLVRQLFCLVKQVKNSLLIGESWSKQTCAGLESSQSDSKGKR